MNKKRFREKTLPATIMVGPVTLWLILLVAVPLIYILVMSFCSIDQYYNVTFQFTFDNYKHLADSSYIKIYVQSLVIALLTTVICIVLAYPFTYIIARTKSRSKKESSRRMKRWIILRRKRQGFMQWILTVRLCGILPVSRENQQWQLLKRSLIWMVCAV